MSKSTESEPTFSSTELDQTKPEDERIPLRLKAAMALMAIGLTLAATFGANEVAKNKPVEMPTQTTLELEDGRTLGAGAELGFFQISPDKKVALPPLPGIKLDVGIQDPVQFSQETTSPEANIQLMEWARKFDVDPASSSPRGPEAISATAAHLDQLRKDGWDINRVTIQGFASDEGDDRQGDNPGFGLPTNEKNIKLADKRADAVGDLFREELFSEYPELSNPDGIMNKIETLGGEEVRDDALAANIETMADELGMDTDDMVMQYNRDPESLPAEARQVLEGLRQNRFVKITIEASRDVATPGQEKTASFILIPIFIPIFRRKRQDVPEDTGITPPLPPTFTPPNVPPRTPPLTPPRVPPIIPPVTPPEKSGPRFEHAPRTLGDERPGYWRVAGHNKDPNTHNGGHSKGSGGNFAAKVHTTHRGNQARKH